MFGHIECRFLLQCINHCKILRKTAFVFMFMSIFSSVNKSENMSMIIWELNLLMLHESCRKFLSQWVGIMWWEKHAQRLLHNAIMVIRHTTPLAFIRRNFLFYGNSSTWLQKQWPGWNPKYLIGPKARRAVIRFHLTTFYERFREYKNNLWGK